MYAIVDIAGQQFRVEKDQKLFVNKLDGETGTKVDFDKVLLIANDGDINVGAPLVEGAMVYATIIEHQKGDKILVFKKKRKKGYRKKTGHRQDFTKILIEDIIPIGAKARTAEKTEAVKASAPKENVSEEAKEKAPKAAKPAAPKKAASKSVVKKAETRKPAVKKAPAAKKTSKKSE